MTPSLPATQKQVATAGLVVPHPEKVTPSSKARIHRDFGYGGEDSFYCAWGPRCAPSRTDSTFFIRHASFSTSCLGWCWVAVFVWRADTGMYVVVLP